MNDLVSELLVTVFSVLLGKALDIIWEAQKKKTSDKSSEDNRKS